MNSYHPTAASAGQLYSGSNQPLEILGWGVDGVVFASPTAMNAVKVHTRPQSFNKELAAYHRLRDHRVSSYMGFSVPRLIAFDRKLRVIEMSVVKPPFLLDFAAAELDISREFSEDVELDWWSRIAEDFGDDFPIAQSVFHGLIDDFGLYYWDIRPRNLQFR